MIDEKLIESNTERNLNEAANVRYLAPDEFVLFKSEAGSLRMTLKDDRSYIRVLAKLCFPFSFPTKYISLRDTEDEEIGIIPDLAVLNKQYRRWIGEDIELRYFTPCITRIMSARHRYGGVEWTIETDRGPKTIITKAVWDTMTEVEIGRYIITDVDGNRYEIVHNNLDEMSKGWLERLI
jgi:hypothetical protein